MDALPSSLSSLTFPSHYPTSREFCHFKNPNYISSPIHSHFNSCKPTSISNKPSTALANRDFAVPFESSSQKSSFKQSQPSTVHHKAASGYAAALVDVARRNNSLEAVAKDVQRFSDWLCNDQLRAFMFDPFTEEIEKGQVLMEVAEKGRFHRNLVVMLKLLVGKNKSRLVNDVLQEFQRIYDELTGTPVVLVSSATKMDKEKLFGIAKRVQKLSGAFKVKVRHVFDQMLPSLAA